jgi:hypothetical protein
MNTVNHTKKILDMMSGVVQEEQTIDLQEAKSPLTVFKIEDLARVPWKKLSGTDDDAFSGIDSENARIAEIKGKDAIYTILVDGNKLILVDEDGEEHMYDFDKIKPVKVR